jgi:anaerobic magnesium-protoporphyrin IX monomethyl ester cyclase
MKVVLISLYDYGSLGVRTLHSVLRSRGVEAPSVFFKTLRYNNIQTPTEHEYQMVVDHVASFQPDLVGISLRSSFYDIARVLTRAIKDRIVVPVVWGGTHVTLDPESAIAHADYAVVGEGEWPLVDLAHALESRGPDDAIPNVWCNHDGTITRNAPRNLTALDPLPFPDWTDTDKVYVENDTFEHPEFGNLSEYWIMTARGCPFQCTYCCNNALHRIYDGKGKWSRRRSVNSVIQELREAKARFPRMSRVNFQDDVFTMDRAWTKAFAEQYRAEIALPFSAMTHPGFCDSEILALLKQAGLRALKMGIQSGSSEIRRNLFRRNQTDEVILDAAHTIARQGLDISYDIIVNNPYENTRDKEITLDLLLKLPRPFKLTIYSLIYFPHTALTEKALHDGIITEADVENHRKKTFSHWRMRIELQHEREDLFFCSLYKLASTVTPKWMVRAMGRSRVLKSRPALLGPTRHMGFVSYALRGIRKRLPV